jgi:hypothetical protein
MVVLEWTYLVMIIMPGCLIAYHWLRGFRRGDLG